MPPKSRTTRAQPQRQEDPPSQTGEDELVQELSSNAPSEPEDEEDDFTPENDADDPAHEGEEDDIAPENGADNLTPSGEPSNQMNLQLRTQKNQQTMREMLFEERMKAKDATIKAQNLELQLLRERRRRRSDDDDDRERSSSKRRAKSPATCDCETYSGLTLFFADCEENFRDQPSKFKEEDAKVRFGSMRIADRKRKQWRVAY